MIVRILELRQVGRNNVEAAKKFFSLQVCVWSIKNQFLSNVRVQILPPEYTTLLYYNVEYLTFTKRFKEKEKFWKIAYTRCSTVRGLIDMHLWLAFNLVLKQVISLVPLTPIRRNPQRWKLTPDSHCSRPRSWGMRTQSTPLLGCALSVPVRYAILWGPAAFCG